MLQPNLTVLVTGAKEMSNPLLEELKLVFHGAKWEVTLLLLVSLSPPLWKNTFFSLQQKHHIACGPCSLGVSEKSFFLSSATYRLSVRALLMVVLGTWAELLADLSAPHRDGFPPLRTFSQG